jgi:hypothetical protein
MLTSTIMCTYNSFTIPGAVEAAKYSASSEDFSDSDDIRVSADSGAALYRRAQLLESRGDLAEAAEGYFAAITRPTASGTSQSHSQSQGQGGRSDAFTAVDAMNAFMRCHRKMGSEHLAYVKMGNAYV